MPLPSDTAMAVGFQFDGNMPRFPHCDSRSLLLDRCADPSWKDKGEKTPRRNFFREAISKGSLPHKCDTWLQFLSQRLGLKPDQLLYAQLQSRLMVNMAGGVMENAGLCLDRFGLPSIPGSAVKGCARRMAIQRLLEAETPEAEDQKATKADLLTQIALVFGWGEQDWKLNGQPCHNETDEQFLKRWQKERSDFAYACGDDVWNGDFIEDVQRTLWKQVLHTEPPAESGAFARACKQRLSHFAGSVQFLPAYLVNVKLADPFYPTPDELGELELDVVTVHHKQYYAEPAEPTDVPQSYSKWRDWKRKHDEWETKWGTAPDVEEPVPVVFPAVAPGHVFAFGLRPCRRTNAPVMEQARAWLAEGLAQFGLGAKTAAGYGWFDCSSELQEACSAELAKLQAKIEAQKAAEQRKKQEVEQAELKRRADEVRRASLPKHEQCKEDFLKSSDESFAATAKRFSELSEEEKRGFALSLKQKRDTAKRWAKKKPELLKPWQDYGQKLQPPIQFP